MRRGLRLRMLWTERVPEDWGLGPGSQQTHQSPQECGKHWLCSHPLISWRSLSVPADLLTVNGTLQVLELFPSPSHPSVGAGSILSPLFILLSFCLTSYSVHPVPWGVPGPPPVPGRCPSREEPWVSIFLLHHLDSILHIFFTCLQMGMQVVSVYSGFKPFVKNMYWEYSLSERKASVVLFGVMGGEGKAQIGECCSLWGKKARLDVASPDSRVTKSLQQGTAETRGQILVRRPKTIEWQYVWGQRGFEGHLMDHFHEANGETEG